MIEKVLRLREAGYVRRCHTARIVGEDYTVGQHSYNMAALLFVLHPKPTKALYEAILLHDSSERWLGDMPAPVKYLNSGLVERYKQVSERVEVKVGIDKPLTNLTKDEQKWLKALDQIEFFLFCNDQVNGFRNQHMARCLEYVEEWITDNFSKLPALCQGFMSDFEFRRTDERI